ncbi:hypothetical protein GPECTOR_52g32 [Gonium pectorale]|uniref:Protein kinase domain-containing protein n=1 Tax=Gonium pectorale TaxID=33097 RepID=A0A150G731_GONPE|nr:hypothetical protein GPECTOR_52g32 [Gonium pectorale]|eukprot:KXZ45631.1 hypothetical protein GPECTOR_52g32 [Gonium pectorale]
MTDWVCPQALIYSFAVATASNSGVEDQWDVWLWDDDRACRATSYIILADNQPSEFFITTDRPCTWTISYLCMEESVVLAAGHTSSSAWYKRYILDPATKPQPSPHASGPVSSGLVLVRSGLIVGDQDPPANLTVSFDDSVEAFWQYGPVVAAVYRHVPVWVGARASILHAKLLQRDDLFDTLCRAGNQKLLALKLLREGNQGTGWTLFNNQGSITGVIGASRPTLDQGPPYELYVGGLSNDYIVAVQLVCVRGFGLCTTVPDRPLLQFVRSPPLQGSDGTGPLGVDASMSSAVFMIKTDTQMTYGDALSYCRSSSYMGLSWSIIGARDALDWYTSMDTRHDAYATIATGGYFWVQVKDEMVATSPGSACLRGGFGFMYGGKDIYVHHFVPSSCLVNAVVVCVADASANTSTLAARGLLPEGAAGLIPPVAPGAHLLSQSRRIGSGPFGNSSCSFSLLPGSNQQQGSASLPSGPVVLSRQLGVIAISVAVQLSNETDSVAVVSALRLGLVGSDGETPALAASAGVASTAGWHSVELSPGEVVVAVSGCAGGFVERLVLHTSAGRMWTTPFSAASLCSAPFLMAAPQGAYLVGIQARISTSPDPWRTKADIAAAISKLHAELSKRQEQLHITTVLGKGSFGVVYLGTWRGLRVAVKTLVVHDALLGKQEYCDVGSLNAALSAGVVGSVAAGGAAALCALTLALDVACGMWHIHGKNIVHGDLSASNVLLASCPRAPDGRPKVLYDGSSEDAVARQRLNGLWRPPVVAKVADFGLSVHMTESQTHASNRFQGTPAYAAPELFSRGHLSKAADVWAFGVLLLELSHGDSIRQLREQYGSDPGLHEPEVGSDADQQLPAWAVMPAGTPAQLKKLISSCLAHEPHARPAFSKVTEVLVDLLAVSHELVERSSPDRNILLGRLYVTDAIEMSSSAFGAY